MNRRSFLTGMAGILAAGAAPAVLPSGVIMPVRKLWTPGPIMTAREDITRFAAEWVNPPIVVYIDGVAQALGRDYIIAPGGIIAFKEPVAHASIVSVPYPWARA